MQFDDYLHEFSVSRTAHSTLLHNLRIRRHSFVCSVAFNCFVAVKWVRVPKFPKQKVSRIEARATTHCNHLHLPSRDVYFFSLSLCWFFRTLTLNKKKSFLSIFKGSTKTILLNSIFWAEHQPVSNVQSNRNETNNANTFSMNVFFFHSFFSKQKLLLHLSLDFR